MNEPEEAVGVTEIARLLGVSTDTVYSKVRSGEIPGFKVGRVWRFWPSEVRAHLSRPRDPWEQSPASRRARRAGR